MRTRVGYPGGVDEMSTLLGCWLKSLCRRELGTLFGGLHLHAAVSSEADVSHTSRDFRTMAMTKEEYDQGLV